MSNLAQKPVPNVAVVGAGFAGLRCADVLLKAGANVTIFEARSRVGGRVHQAVIDGYTVDMGPNWIHGTRDNPVMEIATKTKSVVLDPDERQTIFSSTGERKSEKESIEIGAEVWATVVDAFKYSNDNHDSISTHESLLDFFRHQLPGRFPSDHQKVEEILKEAHMWGFFVGDSIETQSLRCFALEETLEGENVFLATTYKSILEEVQREALQKADIRLNEEIVKIEYRSKRTSVDKVLLTSRHGVTTSYDEVVVTCPLGWLKRNRDVFLPSLPSGLTAAIDHIGYGRLEKLYITFRSAFWYECVSSDSSSVISTESTVSSKPETACPIFTHFQNPLYHPNPASKGSKTWNSSVVSLAHLPAPTSHPTLLFYLYGDSGQHLTSSVAPYEKHSEQYNSILKAFAEPFISRMPNYSALNEDCKPISVLLTSWQTDPYSGYGSYSNFQVGLKEGEADVETMRNAGGLSDDGRGLWLAGEHTAPFVALGTTTGAYWSGEAVAKRIAAAYDLQGTLRDIEESRGYTKKCTDNTG